MNINADTGGRGNATGGDTPGPVEVVRAFLGEMIDRFGQSCGPTGGPNAGTTVAPDVLVALRLGEAAVRLARPDARPRQLAVIGPTQVGKSTVVNLLAGRTVAEVSPLAGYTVHPLGCAIGDHAEPDAWLAEAFPDWRRCRPDELRRDELESYGWQSCGPALRGTSQVARAPYVIWDTPDFDSLSADQYVRGVLEVAALADAYLLVLSKEKYADLSAWKMLRLLAPLGRPLIICLTKLTPDAAEAVTQSLRARLSESGAGWGDVSIVTVEYCPELAAGTPAPETVQRLAAPLVGAVQGALEGAGAGRLAGARALVDAHWEAWTAPLRTELAALEEWRDVVDKALQGFIERYRRDYLEHPQRFDSFRRATVELLELLEIPKLSRWVTVARQAVTWPLRQLWAAGSGWRHAQPGHVLGTEAAVLSDSLETLVTALLRETQRRCVSASPAFAVWQGLGGRLRAEEARLRTMFEQALQAHHARVTAEVHAAATELYEELKRQPARLAAVRTARATIDVGGLLLAVKTAGLSPMDALWAPATFALSSLLVEGFAGVQMGATARRLKRRQVEAVQQELSEKVLATELRHLAERLSGPGVFGLSAERLSAAGAALHAWQEMEHDG